MIAILEYPSAAGAGKAMKGLVADDNPAVRILVVQPQSGELKGASCIRNEYKDGSVVEHVCGAARGNLLLMSGSSVVDTEPHGIDEISSRLGRLESLVVSKFG